VQHIVTDWGQQQKKFMIKIYTFLISCFATTVFTYGQFEKGQKVVGGNIGFSVVKNENPNSWNYSTDNSNVSINPSVSWFNKSNTLWGMGLLYGYSYQKNKINMTQVTDRTWRNVIGINLFSQKFFTLSRNFFFTLKTSGGLGYTFGKQINTTNDIDSESKSSGYSVSLSLSPGLSYRLTPRLLFDADLSNLLSIGYNYNETKGKGATSYIRSFDKNFYLSSALSNTSLGNVGLGFRWLLKR
jgi:hypothetical protein